MTSEHEAVRDSDTPRTRAVIVDDSRDVRYLLATLMELDGRFEIVGEAHTADDGLAVVSELEPDLVIVDLNLGRHDGTWLLRQLRSRHTAATLAVVTGSDQTSDHFGAFEAGADSVHGKMSMTSTMMDDLAAIIERKTAAVS